MLAEYEYRRLFRLNHWEYIDEPRDVIRWMLAIEDEKRAEEIRRQPKE